MAKLSKEEKEEVFDLCCDVQERIRNFMAQRTISVPDYMQLTELIAQITYVVSDDNAKDMEYISKKFQEQRERYNNGKAEPKVN